MKRWPLFLIAAPAAVAAWSSWVGLGGMCGFGLVQPFPGIVSWHLDTAITLPVGVEAYGAYALGDVSLAALTTEQVARFYRDLEKSGRKDHREGEGLSPRTVRYIHTILSAALKEAVETNRIARNPATGKSANHPPPGRLGPRRCTRGPPGSSPHSRIGERARGQLRVLAPARLHRRPPWRGARAPLA